MDQRIRTAAHEVLKAIAKGYTEIYEGSRITVPPMLFFIRLEESDEMPVVQEVPSELVEPFFNEKNPGGKVKLMKLISAMLTGDYESPIPWGDKKDGNAVASFVITEGYAGKRDGSFDPDNYKHGDLEKDPTSDEVILLQLHSLEGTVLFMQRVKKGELLGDIEVMGEKLEEKAYIEGTMSISNYGKKVVH